MKPATELELSGIVNWDRASEFQKMTLDEFQQVDEAQRCGAWRMVRDMMTVPMIPGSRSRGFDPATQCSYINCPKCGCSGAKQAIEDVNKIYCPMCGPV